jgi:pre-mRNA-processing factor 6
LNYRAAYRRITSYREAREKKEREDYERDNPKIQQQFADLKRALGAVTDEEWAAIPEVGDMTGKNRRAKQNLRQRFYAVPDSVLAGARDMGQMDTSISAQEESAANGSGPSNGDADGVMTNFAAIGAAKERQLQSRLDQAGGGGFDSTAGTSTNIDPKGYMTALTEKETKGETPVGDFVRLRQLLESVIRSNPKHGPAWITAARIEAEAGKIGAARTVIARGAQYCPTSEDVWLANIHYNENGTDNANAKIVAANANKNNDRSVQLWLAATDLETDPRDKRRVLQKALVAVPQSVALWRKAIPLEEDAESARLMLAKATELIPHSVELWTALARLEGGDKARAVLNKARRAVPTSHEIWIAAARLEEQLGKGAMAQKIMEKAVKSLARESAMPKREEWITEAEKCEREGAISTCGAIIRETLGWELDEDDDRKDIWMQDAKDCIGRGTYETARAVYAFALRVFPTSKTIWLAAADLERNHGQKEALWALLEKATEAIPHSEVLWLQLAREKWNTGAFDDARLVLSKAFKQNPNNEDIWLAAVKLEADNGTVDMARNLLTEAREEAGTDRVWIKSVAFERQQGDTDAALDLVNRGLQIFPNAAKLWMQKGQIYESLSKLPQAREAYTTGTRACPKSVPLWLLASRVEERIGATVKARSVLDRARLAVPKNAQLWTESVRLERRAGNVQAAQKLLAQGLQDVPTAEAGLLWVEKIWHLEARTARRSLTLEAVGKIQGDPLLMVTTARMFWSLRRLDKAAAWFEKAVVQDADLGDAWVWYWKFLLQHGTEEKQAEVLGRIASVEPRHGEVWQEVAKAPENAKKTAEEILKIAVTKVE